MVRDAPRVGHDSQRWVLIGIGWERRTVGDEQVGDVPGLTPLIGDGNLRVISHYRPALLVDDAAAMVYRLGTVRLDAAPNAPAHCRNDLPESLLHVSRLARLVLRRSEERRVGKEC